MILAVTHAKDEHAPPVLDALGRRGADVFVLDLASLPGHGRWVLGYGGGLRRELRLDGRPPLDLGGIRAVWWRRPRPLVAPPSLSLDQADFSLRQSTDALLGVLTSLDEQALFVNHPSRSDAAGRKTHQLAVAERVGLRLPETLVTSEPDAARAFVEARREGGTVHKAVHSTGADWHRTRRVGPDELAHLEAIRFAPVIFQEHVPGVDVRVTIVGDELFAAEIDARRSSSPDDYRGHEPECRIEPCTLPPPDERALRELVRRLGLSYAAVDFRRRDDGAWFFLELNPGGQWDFVEERTGQPITEAVAALLARGRG